MRLSALLTLVITGCASQLAPPAAEAPQRPGKADDAFVVTGVRQWYLVGNEVTPGADTLDVTVGAPDGTGVVDAWIDYEYAGRLEEDGDRFRGALSIERLAPGEHELLLAADGSEYAFAWQTFQRSHPMYVTVTTDWDDPDNEDAQLARQEWLHEHHPDLVITHFVGPYTFTDPSVTDTREAELAAWVGRMRDEHDDEIGLHIHPYCSFVEQAGVACRATPSFARPYGDATGYTVVLGAYTEEEMGRMLAEADRIFVEHGLGKPTSFRAGGWTTELHTLKALAAAGHVADASGANWARLEEWRGVSGTTLYDWNREHWLTIDDRSQPYYPNVDDILSAEAPSLPILEVPDNGALVDYVTAEEMIAAFQANWAGGALAEPRQLTIGYHPPNFSEAYKARIDGALTHFDGFLASADRGPVVYARVSDLPKIWKR